MSTYVLVHGAWHGAWCWQKTVPLLEQAGHVVVTPELPGLTDGRYSVADITLARYTSVIGDVLSGIESPVVLVGHSMGGAVISQVAARQPEKIQCLVYLAAYLLRHGESVFATAQGDTQAQVLCNLEYGPGRQTATINPAAAKAVFYADCPDDVVTWATERLSPQALAPLSSPVRLNGSNGDRVPRTYIECTEDRAVSVECQRQMVNRSPCDAVMTLETSHSPFLSSPEQLVHCLLACQ